MKRFFLIIASITLFACNDNFGDVGSTVTIYLEDSPADYVGMEVAVNGVEVFDGSKWRGILSYPRTFPILQYTGGERALLAAFNPDSDRYTRLRVTFAQKGNTLSLADETVELLTDSAAMTVEMPLNLEITGGEQYIFCDMDAAKSVVLDDSLKYHFVPSLSVIDIATAGAASGFIVNEGNLKIAQRMWVECRNVNTNSVHNSYTNKSTAALFVRLPEGTYDISIHPAPTSEFMPKTIVGVVVEKAQATNLGGIQMEIKDVEVE